jgi:hypothetical protein
MSPAVPKRELAPADISAGENAARGKSVLDSGLPEPLMMERQQWALWVEAARQWEAAVRENDPQMSIAFAAITLKAREAYIKAMDAREAWEISERRLVPMNEWNAVLQGFVFPISNLLGNIASELCGSVNPEDPDFARGKIQEWLQERMQPRLDSLIKELEVA